MDSGSTTTVETSAELWSCGATGTSGATGAAGQQSATGAAGATVLQVLGSRSHWCSRCSWATRSYWCGRCGRQGHWLQPGATGAATGSAGAATGAARVQLELGSNWGSLSAAGAAGVLVLQQEQQRAAGGSGCCWCSRSNWCRLHTWRTPSRDRMNGGSGSLLCPHAATLN